MKTKQTKKPLPPTDSADSHPDMIRETIRLWERYFGRPVSPEEAREMVANITPASIRCWMNGTMKIRELQQKIGTVQINGPEIKKYCYNFG